MSWILKPKSSQPTLTGYAGKLSPDLVLNLNELARKGLLTPDKLNSRLAHDYRLIKRQLLQRLANFPPENLRKRAAGSTACRKARPVVLVTSGGPAEGKTFSAANLALSLTLEQRFTVLLIDADLARPSLPGIFGYSENTPGLFDYLTAPEKSIEDVILTTSLLPLSILPAGQATSSPAERLAGDMMPDLIDTLTSGPRTDDIVLLDGPPVLAATGAAALAKIADEILLVVGAGETTLEKIGTCLDVLDRTDHVSMIMDCL